MPVPAAIGHRIVHGGPKLRQHCLIDETVLAQLEAATAFAPLHIPSALSVIRFAQEHFPGLPQIACFDTTFHADLPDVARVLPIARELQSEGFSVMDFMAFPANRSCINLRTICRTASSSPISAMAPA